MPQVGPRHDRARVSLSLARARHEEFEVAIHADVWTPLAINPASQRLGFKRSRQGNVMTREATFVASDVPKLEITIEGTKMDVFGVEVTNGVDGNPAKSVLKVTIPADMPIGKHRDNIRLLTNVPEVPTVDFEMRCWVTAPLYISPERINFRYKSEFKLFVRVRATDQAIAFKVKNVRCDLPEVLVEYRESIEGVETLIELSGAPITKDDPRAIEAEGRIRGTLFIETDVEEMPLVEVPVTYMVRM